MCGIVAKFQISEQRIERKLISDMLNKMIHRGPDDEGIYTGPHIGLGQRRLSIIDLTQNGTAPLHNEEKNIWIVFNGEIYNFLELRKLLIDKGHTFYTNTDTEVIVHLYEEHGIDCLKYLNGMFAFVIWDARTNELFAARDRFGEKPFYYAHQNGCLIIASSLDALIQDPSISIAPNMQAIDGYLSYQYVPSPLSAFEGIFKLPSAHYLKCNLNNNLEIKRYWKPNQASKKINLPQEDIEEMLMEKLRQSVRMRMISDVPIGALLSGGIDSGAIVALMSELSNEKIKTFSIGFHHDQFNELPYAREVAERYGTDHYEFIVEPKAIDILPTLVRHYGEPFADSSAIPTYFVSKMTRQHVKVALSGDGGDENFAGYGHYVEVQKWINRQKYLNYPSKLVIKRLINHLKRHTNYPFVMNMLKGLTMLAGDRKQQYQQYMSIVKDQEKSLLYTDEFSRGLLNTQAIKGIWDVTDEDIEEPIDWMMNHDQNNILPDCLTTKVDVASMANSLEVRAPFLDHELSEFAASIPLQYKLKNGTSKHILRSAFKKYLPANVITKPKTGFGVPMSDWLKTDFKDFVRQHLLDDVALKRGLFQEKYIRRLIDEHMSGRRVWSYRLWSLLMLELWFREYID